MIREVWGNGRKYSKQVLVADYIQTEERVDEIKDRVRDIADDVAGNAALGTIYLKGRLRGFIGDADVDWESELRERISGYKREYEDLKERRENIRRQLSLEHHIQNPRKFIDDWEWDAYSETEQSGLEQFA